MVPDEAHEEQAASEGELTNPGELLSKTGYCGFMECPRQTRREGGEQDTDESWSSPDSSDEDDGGPDHVQCMSS